MSNDDLAAALAAFSASDTPDSRRNVLEALAQSDLIFPMAERAPDDPVVRLEFIQDPRGRPVLPAFTGEGELEAWLVSGGHHAKASPPGLLPRLLSFLPSLLRDPFVGLALNPGSKASALVGQSALELLRSGKPPVGDGGLDPAFVTRWPSG
jgi:hypothetical protein